MNRNIFLWITLVFNQGLHANDEIVGYWRTIDDKTGFAKAIVRFQKDTDGTYYATHIKAIPRPDYEPVIFCQNCPAPFTNQKIVGMRLVWNMKHTGSIYGEKKWTYESAYAIDPLSGKIYRGKARLSSDKRRLILRGYIGISALGRTQTWIREDPNSEFLHQEN